jgi:hypothetical protein
VVGTGPGSAGIAPQQMQTQAVVGSAAAAVAIASASGGAGARTRMGTAMQDMVRVWEVWEGEEAGRWWRWGIG